MRLAMSSKLASARMCSAQPRRIASLPAMRRHVAARAGDGSEKWANDSDMDDCKGIVADYCYIDPATGLRKLKPTLGELEQEFIEALTAWYYEGKPKMSDEEFRVLKEELTWMGSQVVVLDSLEQRFLEASMAYAKGKPILSDADFDALKAELKVKGSIVSAQGPRCSIRSKKMYADASTDYARTIGLNVPSALLALGVFAAIDYASGFGLTGLIELPAPYGVWALWVVVLPTLFTVSYALTQIGFRDSKILKGTCPNCGTENFSYFGDVFTVRGARGTNVVECSDCKADLTFDEYKRCIVVTETSEVKQVKIAEAEQKKAAAAAKKAAMMAKKSMAKVE